MCYLCGKEFINISFTSCTSSSNFSLWKGLWWWRWQILERHQGAKNGPGLGLCPTPCVRAEPLGRGLICIQAASLVGEAGLAVVLTNLAKAPDEGWQWTGKHCKGQGWEGRAWGRYPGLSWHAFACLSSPFGKQQLKKIKQRGSRSFSDLWKHLHISAQKCVPSLHTAFCFKHLASPHSCKFIYPFILPLSPSSSLSFSPPP